MGKDKIGQYEVPMMVYFSVEKLAADLRTSQFSIEELMKYIEAPYYGDAVLHDSERKFLRNWVRDSGNKSLLLMYWEGNSDLIYYDYTKLQIGISYMFNEGNKSYAEPFIDWAEEQGYKVEGYVRGIVEDLVEGEYMGDLFLDVIPSRHEVNAMDRARYTIEYLDSSYDFLHKYLPANSTEELEEEEYKEDDVDKLTDYVNELAESVIRFSRKLLDLESRLGTLEKGKEETPTEKDEEASQKKDPALILGLKDDEDKARLELFGKLREHGARFAWELDMDKPYYYIGYHKDVGLRVNETQKGVRLGQLYFDTQEQVNEAIKAVGRFNLIRYFFGYLDISVYDKEMVNND